ncbi:MAG: hypothetical protein JWN34_2343 [Bryobacterales bacterium]|nr:hypothetical protein [Bryobacterales bacterium]
MDILSLVPVLTSGIAVADVTGYIVSGISRPRCEAKIVAAGYSADGALHWRINWYDDGHLIVDSNRRYVSPELALQAIGDNSAGYAACSDAAVPADLDGNEDVE